MGFMRKKRGKRKKLFAICVFDVTAQKDGNFQICIGVMIVSRYEIGKSFWSMSQEV